MKDDGPKPRLEIVPKVNRSEITPRDFLTPAVAQSNLFPSARPGMLIFVYFSDVTEDEFRKTLEFAKPRAVVELRHTPRFDVGSLNRQTVFNFFAREHTAYFDLTSWREKQDEDDLLVQIKEVIERDLTGLNGPVMFLLGSHRGSDLLPQQIVDLVCSVKKTPPDVFAVPHFRSDASKR
jgi:hypothetical protein